ncbi:MAG: 8-amino-7-oxononanoate synthase [Duncaniella sp.]|nr:8-amino-7-oxononanoate synthase [Duncaniella sp.]
MSSFAEITHALRSSGNFRSIPSGDNAQAGLIDLSSNDYLGLASLHELQEKFFADRQNRQIPMTSSAARLLAGVQREYLDLEHFLKDLYNRPALLFNSGYHANTGLISALAQAGKSLIVADKLIHASIIDGITLSKSDFSRFRHNDFNHLERILAKDASKYERVIIVVESLYSMDGDRADIESLIDIKKRYPNSLLYVDEAHAFGVEGPRGLGICQGSANFDMVDVVVGTFGKACASMGAFAAVSQEIKEYIINRARSFIFSTAIPPLTAAWTRYMIETFIPMDNRRNHLRQLGYKLKSILQPLSPRFPITASHIQPLVIGDALRTVDISNKLREEGFKVLPIRTPTVPPGTERLRISLNASLSLDDIDRFGVALKVCI